MKFTLELPGKNLEFDSELSGLEIGGTEYASGKEGILIYDQTKGLKSNSVRLQMSSNTSTLIPALRSLNIPYHSYFDQRNVIESQNNITFYWDKSKLAAFYNRYSTDQLEFAQRETVIRNAVNFLIKHTDDLPLGDELLDKVLEPVKLLGFYEGFPIFDASTGFAKLLSRLGIHVELESIMVSTPLDKYEFDVYELADKITQLTGIEHEKKKNRVSFEKEANLLKLLSIKNL